MNYAQFKETIHALFGDLIDQFKDQGEYGFNHQHAGQINTIGYTTNLTPEVVE